MQNFSALVTIILTDTTPDTERCKVESLRRVAPLCSPRLKRRFHKQTPDPKTGIRRDGLYIDPFFVRTRKSKLIYGSNAFTGQIGRNGRCGQFQVLVGAAECDRELSGRVPVT